jgi:hypothetical protein
MHDFLEQLTPNWFQRAFVYTGSFGEFRFRFARDAEARLIRAAVYSGGCYEVAQNRQEREFSWDEEGVAALKEWLSDRYEAFSAAP